MEDIKRTERGWCGYIQGYQYCLFRRNTLIEYNNKKIVIATLGNFIDPFRWKVMPLKDDIWYESIAGYAIDSNGYWDINPQDIIPIRCKHTISGTLDHIVEKIGTPDIYANKIHEDVVNEMIDRICV